MQQTITSETTLTTVAERIGLLRREIQRAIVGKERVVDQLLTAFLAKGHVLIEDLPGLGKTTLARALALALDGTFARVQFTPDLLPSDILGTSIYHQNSGEFAWRNGPVFSNLLLADEINRATPRTQSALLEAMSEGQVSSDGLTRPLPEPFMVVATQNPVEHVGTYPLPESQMDRFMLCVSVGYPKKEDEREMLRRFHNGNVEHMVSCVWTLEDMREAREHVSKVRIDDSLVDYILDIIAETRRHPRILAGASPRASLHLYRAVQASALVHGREFVTPDDIKHLAPSVLAHRIVQRISADNRGRIGAVNLIRKILEDIRVPD